MQWFLWCLGVLIVTCSAPAQVTGDECLFCHRNDIGPGWQKNRHGLTIRQREGAPDRYLLGSRDHVRHLRKEAYGKFAIQTPQGAWDADRFADRCAGCHASGLDPAAKTFAAFGIDCYMCHGNADLAHANDISLVWFSKKRRSDATAITSICAGCHLRGGRSRSTGLPYPVRFTAGDDLFSDFQADFAQADDPGLHAGDRHIYRNVRDIVVRGERGLTCLSCHQVHSGSSQKHRRVLRGPICQDCHHAQGPMKVVRRQTMHSAVCEY